MAETLDLQIVTPTGIAVHKEVTEVTAPSVAGEFGVLPSHVPLLAALAPGVVTYKIGGDEVKVAIANGFAQIADDRALILTERFTKKEDVDPVAVRARLKDVGAELGEWAGEHDAAERRALIDEEQWLAAQLELIGDRPETVREDTRFVERDIVVAESEGEETPTDGGAA